uniref:Nuclear receptor domain-containing protein n=1 Tax=Caenorhabditis tropicalis TaxID=1561998 RepID=A0A1I7V0X2_9PELO
MRTRKVESDCSICGQEGDGYHFGAETCKACAAFFRRSVIQKKEFQCNGNKDCDLVANVRCMCRACRFSKCLEMGMNSAGVQQAPPPSPPSMAFLTKMKENYQKLENAREVIHKKEKLFENTVPRAVNYLEAIRQGMSDVALGADWISRCFEEFATLPMEQKNIVFGHFYVPFYTMEGAFRSHQKNSPNKVIMPSGDFMDFDHLELFYKNEGEEQEMTKEQIDKLFKPTFLYAQQSLILPMMTENLDLIEFLSLCTLLLWDTSLEGITDETVRIGKKIKDQVMEELSFHLTSIKRLPNPVVRTATIIGMLPAVYRLTRRIQDDLEITKVFKIYTASKEFYDLINGNFC